jgi:hypothetical protein
MQFYSGPLMHLLSGVDTVRAGRGDMGARRLASMASRAPELSLAVQISAVCM